MMTQNVSTTPSARDPAKDLKVRRAEKVAILTETILPYVDAVIRPRAERGIDSLMRRILANEPVVMGFIEALRKDAPPASDPRATAFRACGVGPKGSMTAEEMQASAKRSIRDAVEHSAMQLVLGWLDAFERPGGEIAIIDVRALDDAMLPALDAKAEKRFADRCSRACMSVKEARDALRKVRAALPPDVGIPDAATEYLDLSVYTFRR